MDAFEIEHGHAEYAAAELLEQARANAQALLLGTVAFLREQGVDAGAWAAALGEAFGRGWGEARPWDAAEFLDAMLTNYRALGAEILAARLGTETAEATLGPFPDPDLCALLGRQRARGTNQKQEGAGVTAFHSTDLLCGGRAGARMEP